MLFVGGHEKDVTTSWPMTSWTQAMGGSSPPSVFLEMYVLFTIPSVGAIFKDAALREPRVIEAIF